MKKRKEEVGKERERDHGAEELEERMRRKGVEVSVLTGEYELRADDDD